MGNINFSFRHLFEYFIPGATFIGLLYAPLFYETLIKGNGIQYEFTGFELGAFIIISLVFGVLGSLFAYLHIWLREHIGRNLMYEVVEEINKFAKMGTISKKNRKYWSTIYTHLHHITRTRISSMNPDKNYEHIQYVLNINMLSRISGFSLLCIPIYVLITIVSLPIHFQYQWIIVYIVISALSYLAYLQNAKSWYKSVKNSIMYLMVYDHEVLKGYENFLQRIEYLNK